MHPWMGFHHTRGLTPCYACEHVLRDPPHTSHYNLMHSSCFCTLGLGFLQFINLTLDPAVLKKWKTACAFFWEKKTKQIITNYMSAHIWAFPALISIILWCNRISWVSSALFLNVTLGRRSDLPWRWHAHCSSEEGIDRSSKAQSRGVTAG